MLLSKLFTANFLWNCVDLNKYFDNYFTSFMEPRSLLKPPYLSFLKQVCGGKDVGDVFGRVLCTGCTFTECLHCKYQDFNCSVKATFKSITVSGIVIAMKV